MWNNAPRHQREAFILKAMPTRGYSTFKTPGELAMALDPLTIQTPMLDLIDSKLLLVRDAIGVMYERKAMRSKLIQGGMEPRKAIERAQKEVEDKGIKRLMISVPPQEGKSTRISRYFLLWLMQQFPQLRTNLVSYDLDNAAQFTMAMLADITTFNGEEGNIDLGLRLRYGQRAQSFFATTAHGFVRARGKGGGLTGRPSELGILDDLIKDQEDADSENANEKTWTWLQTVFFPRLAPDAPVVMPMTRWSEDDPNGRLQAQQEELEKRGVTDFIPWVVVNVPAKAEKKDLLGRKEGEWLLSARGRTDEQWRIIEATTDAKNFASLYQGSPSVAKGDVFLDEWKREYNEPVWRYDAEHDCYYADEWDIWQSWDLAFKDKTSNDFVAGGVFATQGAVSRLVTLVNKHLSFTDTIIAMRRMKRLFPTTGFILVEDKANGSGVIDSLQNEVPGIVGITPKQSKVERARLTTPYVRAGNYQIPSKRLAALQADISFDVDAYWHQVKTFRENAPHDDMVDMTTQFLNEKYRAGDASVDVANERLPTGPQVAIGNPQARPTSSIVADRIAAARGGR